MEPDWLYLQTVASNTTKVMEVISLISNSAMLKLNSFSQCNSSDSLKRLQTIPEYSEMLMDIENKIPLEKIKYSCLRNNDHLKKLNQEIENLKVKQKELEERKVEEEMRINTSKQKISHLKEKQKYLQEKRDEILVYKLLTNTNFMYTSKNVKGYIVGETPESIECFDLKPKKLSQKEITEKLYSLIRKVYMKPFSEKNESEKEFDII